VKGFTLTPTEIKEMQRWLDFVHKDVEDALLTKFNIQGIDQLRSSQMDEVIDAIQELHKRKSKK